MTGQNPNENRMNYPRVAKVMLLVAFCALLLAGFWFFDLRQVMLDMLAWIENAGTTGILLFLGLYIIAGIFMLPGLILTMGAGVIFGVVKGSIIVYFAGTAAATAGFLVGRYLARDLVSRKMSGNRAFQALDRAVALEGWKIVGLTRLSPLFPYNILNYAFGLTSVSIREYVIASFIGMMPVSTVYVYLGSIAGNLAELGYGSSGNPRSTLEWFLYALGLVATVTVAVIITRSARRALNEKIASGQDPEEFK